MKIDPKILASYEPPDTFYIFNEQDRDLANIRVEYPTCPPIHTIEGYGLKKEEQYFRKVKIPRKLIEIEDIQDADGFLTRDQIWELINKNADFYKEEIKFIQNEWRKRLYGHWVFIFGKPTYIPNWFYFYLNYWHLPEGTPEFRERDRLFFVFAEFCYKDPDCYGFIDVKHRRAGSTSKAQCINFCIISILQEAYSGIQSKTDEDARRVFQNHLINPFKKVPFWFKPITSSDEPMTTLAFRAPVSKGVKGLKRKSKRALMSAMNFESSGEQAYDGAKLHFWHSDECGKLEHVDINNRWDIVRPTLAQGAGNIIHGYSLHTSTSGEMSKGGLSLKQFCEDSNYAERNDNGQTGTGLYTMFLPAWEGLDGYVGRYGESIIETPTESQKQFLRTHKVKGKVICRNPEIGAKQFIQNTIDGWKKKKNYKKLNEFMRQNPTSWRGSFIADASQSFFDLVKINERLDELHDMPTATVSGYFEWTGPKFRSDVKFIPDTENVRFELSKQLVGNEANRVKWNERAESYEALNYKYCGGCDPFKANDTKGKKNSLGGGAVWWGHDIIKDPLEKPYEEWESNRFICTYLFRPEDKEIYAEDMIMMAHYFGCAVFIETNVPDLREAFIKYGYRGMMVHAYNVESETIEGLAGQATSTKTKQQIFKLFQHYVNRHCGRERHKKMLEQIRDTVEIADMTDNDLFSAGGYAMLGFEQFGIEMQKYDRPVSNPEDTIYIKSYSY